MAGMGPLDVSYAMHPKGLVSRMPWTIPAKVATSAIGTASSRVADLTLLCWIKYAMLILLPSIEGLGMSGDKLLKNIEADLSLVVKCPLKIQMFSNDKILKCIFIRATFI